MYWLSVTMSKPRIQLQRRLTVKERRRSHQQAHSSNAADSCEDPEEEPVYHHRHILPVFRYLQWSTQTSDTMSMSMELTVKDKLNFFYNYLLSSRSVFENLVNKHSAKVSNAIRVLYVD